MVALTGVLRRPARAVNQNRFLDRPKIVRPPSNRLTRYAPSSASLVFPTAIITEVDHEPAVSWFTRKAPTKMPGHARRGPRISTAARAMPVGGHTDVAREWRSASVNPILPATRYALARSS